MANPKSSTFLRPWPTSLALLSLLAFLMVPSTRAFDPGIHEEITETTLQGLGFDEDSADEVGDSNFWTDTFEATSAGAHADGNQLGAASERLRQKRTAIGDALNACRRRDALDALGEALHTVQDIYSHSNSVDNNIAIPDLLGLSDGTATCDPANNFAPGGLVTGHFSALGYILGKLADPPIPRGQCLGTPAGDCCHFDLNKDNDGVPNRARHAPAKSAAGSATQTYEMLVEEDIRDRFSDEQEERLIKMLKKKQRTVMFVIDDTGSMSSDLAGVKAEVNQQLDKFLADDEAPTLGLVTFKDFVRNRGLTCDVDQLRSQINGLFASGGGDCPEAMNSALLSAIFTFPRGRSDIQLRGGQIFSATDASARDAFLGPQVQIEAAVRGINIDSILTGDCTSDPVTEGTQPVDGEPEDATGGANPTVVAMEPAATIATGTESHTGDPLTSPSARVQLAALTEQTGGVLFSVFRSEVDEVSETLLAIRDLDSAVLFKRRVELTPGTPVTIDVPVDDTVGQLTLVSTGATFFMRPVVALTRPDGNPAVGTDPDVTERILSSVVSHVVSAPATGVWRVTLSGEGATTLRAFASSDLRLNSLRLLSPTRVTTRPEIEFLPIDGQPQVGDTVIADLRFTIPVDDADLTLVREDGSILDHPLLFSSDGLRRFRAEVVVPDASSVNLELRGNTVAGNPFVRQVSAPVLPQTVAITASPSVAVGPRGGSAPINLEITNSGTEPGTFVFIVSTPLGWGVTFLTGPVTVEAGETVNLEPGILVNVPTSAFEGQRNDMLIRLQDITGAPRRNSSSFSVVAGSTNRPPDCSGATPSQDTLWPPNHEFAAIDVLGVTDPDGDLVEIVVTGISQDEAVDAPGSGNTAPDGGGVGTSTAQVRAERAGNGDGRVYAISFTADDGKGGTCNGEVRVGVPHSVKDTAIDSGQAFDSTVVP